MDPPWESAINPRALVDAPPASNFLRREFCSVIVIGKYVYIDGGEVSQYEGEYNETGNYPSRPVNSTISIGLTEPWDPSSVTMKTIAKTQPYNKLNEQAVWKDPDSDAFYTWGGWTRSKPPDEKIMRFTADGKGGGLWAPLTVPHLDLIKRTRQGRFSQSKNIGYFFGGFTGEDTESNFRGNQSDGGPAPGLVSFDMRSHEIQNFSSSRFGKYDTFRGGSLQFAPSGPEGLLVVLGGEEAAVSAPRISAWDRMAFDKISVYDPRGDKWYYQQTTGDNPSPMERFCTAGVPGPNNTYEILTVSDDVHVLSLPGFEFFKADNSNLSTPRVDHACTVIGGRQMLSVGGMISFRTVDLSSPDPWPLGLGIFDMTELRWTNRFDPDAGAYDSPKVVKDWYSQGNVANWESPELKELFSQWSPNATARSPDDTRSQPSGPNIGAIVGGAVGGVAALGLVTGLVLFFRSRRMRQVVAAPQDSSPAAKFGSVGTAYTAPTLTEIDEADSNNLSELPGNHGVPPLTETHEADSCNILELPANHQVPPSSHGPQPRHEMAA
ncbi:Kelch repeat-containing protein [Colletotrichum siamense]|nr:Kelch repeat-containing protein [Colletotrichum siamense]